MSSETFLTTWSLYAFLDYQKCYETLTYLGLERPLDEAFTKRSNKKSLKDFKRMKESKAFSLLVIESAKYRTYIDPLFLECK
jgi:hypothetical protein